MDLYELKTQYGKLPIFLYSFFEKLWIHRNVDAVLSMLSEDVSFYLASDTRSGNSKQQFHSIMKEAIHHAVNSYKISFKTYHQKINDSITLCTIIIERHYIDSYYKQYIMSLYTTCIVIEKDSCYYIDNLHISEIDNQNYFTNELHLAFAPDTIGKLNRSSQQELIQLLSRALPIGIIGVFLDEYFSLYVINDKMLEMLGYTYEEYLKETNGHFRKSIHPEDNFIFDKINQQLEKDTQYEVEYRIKRKDGSYIWICDIGRKVITEDNKEAIICALFDISKSIEAKNDLYLETLIDPLTNTYNRKGGGVLIKEKLTLKLPFSFIIMDIDNFKKINDTYGHIAGDQVLTFIGNLLSHCFRKNDIIMRLGGDEFAIFLHAYDKHDEIQHRLKSIMQDYQRMIQEKYPISQSTLSFGGIISHHSMTLDEMYVKADEILYEIKHHNKNNCIIKEIS